MYRDNTLIPSEAIRLAALGSLMIAPQTYAALAQDIRTFTQHIAGPSLDLIGTPLEVLVVEGLIQPKDGGAGPKDHKASGAKAAYETETLAVTPAGREEFRRLMGANMRAPVNDLNKLIIALKMRFLHLLEEEDAAEQVELLTEMTAREAARLQELRAHYADSSGHFIHWLDQDIDLTLRRLDWLKALPTRMGGRSPAPVSE